MIYSTGLRKNCTDLAINCFTKHEANSLNDSLIQTVVKVRALTLAIIGSISFVYIGITAGYALGVGLGLLAAYSLRVLTDRLIISYEKSKNQDYVELGESLLSNEFQNYLIQSPELPDELKNYLRKKTEALSPEFKDYLSNDFRNHLDRRGIPQNGQVLPDEIIHYAYEKILQEKSQQEIDIKIVLETIVPIHKKFLEIYPPNLPPEPDDIVYLKKDELVFLSKNCDTKFNHEANKIHTLIHVTSIVAAVVVGILAGPMTGCAIGWVASPLLPRIYNCLSNLKSKQIVTALRTASFQRFISIHKQNTGFSILFYNRNIARIYDDYIRSISPQRPAEEFVGPQSEVQNVPPPSGSPLDDGNHPSWCAAK